MTVCYWCGSKDTLADVGKELDDGKYKMVQCSKCKNAYYVVNKEKINKPKQPITNEEWIKQANTEQLAKFIFWQHFDVYGKTLYELMVNASRGVSRDRQAEVMIGAVVEWLKEKHE